MYVKSLKLTNFRNYRSLSLELNATINIFVGNNAQGKTNLLESIFLLAMGKSFRAVKEKELILAQQEICIVSGIIQKQATMSLQVSLSTSSQKKLLVNKKETSPSDFIGNLNVVLFTPDDLQLIKGSPSERRRFLDSEISQVNPTYRKLYSRYQKILFQRNQALKNFNHKRKNDRDTTDLLAVWDEQLVDVGSKIILKRSEMVYKLNLLARLIHRKITGNLEELSLVYVPFFINDFSEAQEFNKNNWNLDGVKAIFYEKLKSEREAELIRGYSLVGPQRDDLIFLINGVNARRFGSQGQQRTAVLACRLAELEYMKSETGSFPVVLLDDVMSELDIHRRSFLIEVLSNKFQTVITTTDVNDIDSELLRKGTLFEIEAGQVRIK